MSAPRNPAGILPRDVVFSDVSTGSLVAQQTQVRSLMLNKGLHDLFSGSSWNGGDLVNYSADGGVAVNSATDVNGVKVVEDYTALFGEVADNLTPATRIARINASRLKTSATTGNVNAPAGASNIYTFQMYTGNAADNGAGWLHYPTLAPFMLTANDGETNVDAAFSFEDPANPGTFVDTVDPKPQWIAVLVGNRWKAIPCWDFKDTAVTLSLATHLT